MTPEDTPRMAERTDRQAQIDPWDSVHQEFADMSQWETVRVYRTDAVDAARAADAALLRERDAQIASLTAQVERWRSWAQFIYLNLSSSPRPQEPQPAEPKSSETRKPVVNLMEALKKSLDSLNAKRTQEPGGHQP